MAPLSPGFNLNRYDCELRRPFPSEPRFATESNVWRREHAIADPAKPAASVHEKATTAAFPFVAVNILASANVGQIMAATTGPGVIQFALKLTV